MPAGRGTSVLRLATLQPYNRSPAWEAAPILSHGTGRWLADLHVGLQGAVCVAVTSSPLILAQQREGWRVEGWHSRGKAGGLQGKGCCLVPGRLQQFWGSTKSVMLHASQVAPACKCMAHEGLLHQGASAWL